MSDAVSQRWTAWRATIGLDEYEARFAGSSAHGEADFIESLSPASVLDAGCGTGRVAIELARRGMEVVGVDLDADLLERARRKAPGLRWVHDDLARMQLDRRFDVVAMPGNVMLFCRVEDRRAVVHSCAQHLLPGGRIVAGFSLRRGRHDLTLDQWDELCRDCDLDLVERWATWDRQPFEDGDYVVTVHRRTERFNVHDLLFEARAAIRWVHAEDLAASLRTHTPPTVLDTRTHTDRLRFGVIEGSVHAPRTVLEWHLDPANGYRHQAIRAFDQALVVVCNGGYSSSLAAASLTRIGFTDVADLVGGMAAWRAAGLPVVAPDHSHLDF